MVLFDSVWRMPLRVLRSGTAIVSALRAQRTISAADKRVSWHTACLPLSEASNSREPLPALGTADKQVSWHIKSVPLPEAPNSGEPLPALFPNSGEPLQSMQSEETVAIWQHLQATDSDNFDVHVEEYIIQEHIDDEISSDGTVAWEHNIRHLHHITTLLTTCPADLPVKPPLPAAQSAYHTHLATQESVFAQPAIYVFTQNMLHKLHPVSWSAAVKNHAGVASRAHMYTLTSSSINSRFTQHMCVPLCWKRHALIPNHARAAPT